MLFGTGFCKAQTISSGFYREIIFTRTHYTLYELAATVAAQSGLSVSFNAQKIDPRKKVRIAASRITVEKLMQVLHRKASLKYTIVSGHLLLLPQEKKSFQLFSKEKMAKIHGRTMPHHAVILPKIRLAEYADNPVKTSTNGDLLIVQPAIGSDSSTAAISGNGSIGGAGNGGKWIDPYQSLSADNGLRRYNGMLPQTTSFVADHIFADIGAGITESFYGNPTLHAGFDFLHVTAAYYFNPSFSHFRYGLGGAVDMNERWQIRLELTSGSRFSSNINVPYNDTIPRTDTLQPPVIISQNQIVQLSSRLTSLTLALAYKFTERLSAVGGIQLNSLRTQYYLNDRQVTPASLEGIPANPGDDFRTLKVPYYLSDNFNVNQTEDRKLWIGINLSLYYRLF